MNKAEEIRNSHRESESHHATWTEYNVRQAMLEYGKYCAEQAFTAGFYEGQEYYPSTFSDFWSEFQSKEETK